MGRGPDDHTMHPVETHRLFLRPIEDRDLPSFVSLNANPTVMRHFPNVLSPQESRALFDRVKELAQDEGLGLMTVELKDTGALVGFMGLGTPRFLSYFTPCTEIMWRLHQQFWGHGYATEGAKAILKHGLEHWGHHEIFAFTPVKNKASIAVMQKIGMQPHPQHHFTHPSLPNGHPLEQHVLYRAQKAKTTVDDGGA